MKKFFEAGIDQEERLSMLDVENLEEGLGKGYKIEFGDWNRGGFSGDIFVEHAETEEEAIRIGTGRYTKGAGEAVYVWSPKGELVLERRDDIDIEQSYIDGFIDALKSLAPSYDAEEDMHVSGKPWAEYSFIGTPDADLATEAIAYEAGKKAAEAVADEIEKLSATEAEMERERVEEESENDIQIVLDGNAWCAYRLPFRNLQEDNAGFGATPQMALIALLESELPDGLEIKGESK